MSPPSKPAAGAEADLDLTIIRRIAAPPRTLFEAWTDAARLASWIGPRNVRAEIKQMEARPGGAYRIDMHLPSGEVVTVRGIYRELVLHERLAFTWAWDHDQGVETLVTVTFRAEGGGTEMTLHQSRFANAERRDSHDRGWSGSFDKLAEMVAGQAAQSSRR